MRGQALSMPRRLRRRRGRGDASGFVRVQPVVERVQADAESLGGRTLVAVQMLERAHDELALDVANRTANREPLLSVWLVEWAVETLWQTQHGLVRIRHDRRAQHDVPQLAHVAGPVIGTEARRILWRESAGLHAGRRLRLPQEMVDEQRHVLNARAQWRQRDWEYAEPIVQVFSQGLIGDC